MKLTSFVTAVVTTVLLTHCTQEETNQIIPTASVQDLEEVSSNKIYLSDEQRPTVATSPGNYKRGEPSRFAPKPVRQAGRSSSPKRIECCAVR